MVLHCNVMSLASGEASRALCLGLLLLLSLKHTFSHHKIARLLCLPGTWKRSPKVASLTPFSTLVNVFLQTPLGCVTSSLPASGVRSIQELMCSSHCANCGVRGTKCRSNKSLTSGVSNPTMWISSSCSVNQVVSDILTNKSINLY